ncbi:MAG: radical SAM protein [bacterium]
MVYKKSQSRKTSIFPLGLGHLAAVLEKDYEVKLLDSALQGFDNEVEQENGLNCYGLTDDQYIKAIADFAPDVVGVSCLFSSLQKQALRVADLAKQTNPHIITVMGGPHASALPGIVMRHPSLDFAVIGEGEQPLLGLLERLRQGKEPADLDGIAYRKDGEIKTNPALNLTEDLDSLPFPAWHLLDMETYFNIGSVQGLRMDGTKKRLRLLQIATSRGCPFSCTYCGKSAVWGDGIRFMSPRRVMELLELAVEKYSVERIAFQDDNLTVNKKRAHELFQLMAGRQLPLTWEAHNGLAFSTLDESILDAMKESGCVSFTGAVESGSPQVLKKVKKKVDLERAIELADYARKIGLDVRAFYIIGFPGETAAQIEATREHMRRMQASVSALALYTPLPGSLLYQELESQGVLDSNNLDFEKLSFGAFDMQLSEVTVDELHRIRKIDWIKNVFADRGGNLKEDLDMDPQLAITELKNGLELYPDSPEIIKLYEQAKEKYGRELATERSY